MGVLVQRAGVLLWYWLSRSCSVCSTGQRRIDSSGGAETLFARPHSVSRSKQGSAPVVAFAGALPFVTLCILELSAPSFLAAQRSRRR